MALVRWTDDRLDDIAVEIRLVSKALPTIAEHGVHIAAHGKSLDAIAVTLDRLDTKLDATGAAFRVTPGMKLAASVPIITSLVACIGVIIASGGGPG